MRKMHDSTYRMTHRFTDTGKHKPRNHTVTLTVPQMAKVTPPNKSRDKIPVFDPRLRINFSKVSPLISIFVDVLGDVVTSLRALTASTPSCFGDATAEQGAKLFPIAALYMTPTVTGSSSGTRSPFQAVDSQARPFQA
jgi:hypothetical protein